MHNYEEKQIYSYKNFVSNNTIDLDKIYSHNIIFKVLELTYSNTYLKKCKWERKSITTYLNNIKYIKCYTNYNITLCQYT